MSWSSIILSVLAGSGWAAFGFMALRTSGIKSDRDAADVARKEQAKELEALAEAHTDNRERLTFKLKDLENEIKTLESELESCATPGSRRVALGRLLQKASTARHDSERSLH